MLAISCIVKFQFYSHIAVDKTISIYDTVSKSCKFVFEGHDKGINTITWSPDSRYLASCSDDKTIRIWNCEKVHFPSYSHCRVILFELSTNFLISRSILHIILEERS